MAIPPSILMSLLSSGVRAVRGAIAPTPMVGAGQTDFGAMLGRARAGELSTGLPVTIARGAEIELSDAQLERLAAAADRAESAGATRALALIDGRAIEIDIASRTATREHPLEPGRTIVGIDAVIDAGATIEASGTDAGAPDLALPRPALGAGALALPHDRSRWSPSLLATLGNR